LDARRPFALGSQNLHRADLDSVSDPLKAVCRGAPRLALALGSQPGQLRVGQRLERRRFRCGAVTGRLADAMVEART
jgi:hypothetical protein